jgi:hypothetical protein
VAIREIGHSHPVVFTPAKAPRSPGGFRLAPTRQARKASARRGREPDEALACRARRSRGRALCQRGGSHPAVEKPSAGPRSGLLRFSTPPFPLPGPLPNLLQEHSADASPSIGFGVGNSECGMVGARASRETPLGRSGPFGGRLRGPRGEGVKGRKGERERGPMLSPSPLLVVPLSSTATHAAGAARAAFALPMRPKDKAGGRGSSRAVTRSTARQEALRQAQGGGEPRRTDFGELSRVPRPRRRGAAPGPFSALGPYPPASCPQAAPMSAPMDLRTVTVTPARERTSRNVETTVSSGARKGSPATGL